ncbi:hypothetical protein HY546_03745 [archaeon]|nr:hypothetical protein [archaeon]
MRSTIMRESAGKRVARALFYKECLPSWLEKDQLRAGTHVVLLGDVPTHGEPYELPFFDELGIPRNNIWSLERKPAVYRRQSALNHSMTPEKRVALWCGEARDFLGNMLHTDQSFSMLNLDIEGTYLRHLDPMMHAVLLFCWRNPETVVATYSTVGRRDAFTIFEGVKSLALFLWLCPNETSIAFGIGSNRYAQAGFAEPVRMVLRDLFWLRSHLENAAIASAMVETTSQHAVRRLFDAGDVLWKMLQLRRRKKLTYGLLEQVVSAATRDAQFKRETQAARLPHLGIRLSAFQHMVYRANPPWSNLCYFARFSSRDTPRTPAEWAAEALAYCVESPLIYVDHSGVRTDINYTQSEVHFARNRLGGLELWDRRNVYSYSPRRLPLVPSRREHKALAETARRLATERQQEKLRPHNTNPDHRQERALVVDRRLAELQARETVRALIRRGANIETIMRNAGVTGILSRSTVVAMVAIAHRPGGGRVFVRSGGLTEFGRAEVRRLLKAGYSAEEMIVQRLVGGNVTAAMINMQAELMRIENGA